MAENIWFCKIGGDVGVGLPPGSDAPMRAAIERAFCELTGRDAEFTFSGWGQKLTEGERAVVENRAPRLCEVDRPHHYECKHCGIGPPTVSAQETSPVQAVCNRAAHLSDVPVRHAVTCKLFPDPYDEREPAGPCTCGATANRGHELTTQTIPASPQAEVPRVRSAKAASQLPVAGHIVRSYRDCEEAVMSKRRPYSRWCSPLRRELLKRTPWPGYWKWKELRR